MQITFRNKTYETKPNITARDALKKIGLDPESVLITVNGKLVTDDAVLREEDQVKLVAVVSGGADHFGFSIFDLRLSNPKSKIQNRKSEIKQ